MALIARQVGARLLAVLAFGLFAFGFVAGVVVTGGSWVGTAVRLGWADARRKPASREAR